MRYARRCTLRLCFSTRTRNASRSPASVCATATASLSPIVSTLGLIRFIRQYFRPAVRFAQSLTALKQGHPAGSQFHLPNGMIRTAAPKYRIITKALVHYSVQGATLDSTVYARGHGPGVERRQ